MCDAYLHPFIPTSSTKIVMLKDLSSVHEFVFTEHVTF